jgi:hypothetical protein
MMACSAMGTLNVTVSDDEKGSPICDATVTVTPPGGMPMVIAANGMGPNCSYSLNVTPGTYQISIVKTGFGSAASSVNVTTVDCVTGSPTLSFPLTRK